MRGNTRGRNDGQQVIDIQDEAPLPKRPRKEANIL